jgi:Fic family protein
MEIQLPVNQEILTSISHLDRFRGQWSVEPPIPATRLERIREASRIQSIGASCRLSGIRVSDIEVAGLLRQDPVPIREAAEVRGYAAALDFPFPTGHSLLNADQLRHIHAALVGRAEPSDWRTQQHHREAFDREGRATGRIFPTLPPRMIESKVDELLTWLEFELRTQEHHAVPVIGTFVLGLLITAPFPVGNARLARVLIPHLLRRAGYDYVPYASIDREIEELRDSYYAAYDRAEGHFWSGEAQVEPWIEFFLEVLSRHRQRVEAKVELEREALDYPPLQRAILETVRDHGSVDARLLIKATGANRNTLKDNLRRLVDNGVLERTGQRRAARYRMALGSGGRTVGYGDT